MDKALTSIRIVECKAFVEDFTYYYEEYEATLKKKLLPKKIVA